MKFNLLDKICFIDGSVSRIPYIWSKGIVLGVSDQGDIVVGKTTILLNHIMSSDEVDKQIIRLTKSFKNNFIIVDYKTSLNNIEIGSVLSFGYSGYPHMCSSKQMLIDNFLKYD